MVSWCAVVYCDMGSIVAYLIIHACMSVDIHVNYIICCPALKQLKDCMLHVMSYTFSYKPCTCSYRLCISLFDGVTCSLNHVDCF